MKLQGDRVSSDIQQEEHKQQQQQPKNPHIKQ